MMPITDTQAQTLAQSLQAGEHAQYIPGYEGVYAATTRGRIYSFARPGTRARFLTPSADARQGYLKVNLSLAGVVKTQKVHRLVALTFIGPIPDDMVVRHLNDDPSDVRLENLAIGTYSENGHDAVRNGRHPGARMTHCSRGHEYTAENTRLAGRKRVCLTCRRAWNSAHSKRVTR